MISGTVLTALAFAASASAHATVGWAFVNDVEAGDGANVYIRSPPNNDPVKDLSSAAMACNVNGGKAVTKFVSAAAGDKVTIEWMHNSRGDDIIAASHLGPVITWIAPYTEDDASGAIWTKIAEEGYDSSTKKWAVDNLISNKGQYDFTIPSSLAAGKYLIKSEIIALHEADTAYSANSARGAQFYPSCLQFDVTGTGSAVPDQNFDFNTGYTYTDPGIVFNVYSSYTSYTIPGPEVWTGSSSGGGGSASTSKAATPTSTKASSAASSAASSTKAATTTSAAAATTTGAATGAPTTTTTLKTSVKPTSAGQATKTGNAATPSSTKKPCGKARKARRNIHKKF